MRRILVLLPVALLVAAAAAMTAEAIVPPRNCGYIRVSGKRYQIKSDQLRCTTARRYATRYMARGIRPRGYRCYRYRESSLKAKCVNRRANPDKTIFIIKRR
ncbi:MAG: hypothetical protein M3303_10015 [Gemmatimonadota bacterium]|nr:hypothetical protein [Gemmatimonadota bacterium]